MKKKYYHDRVPSSDHETFKNQESATSQNGLIVFTCAAFVIPATLVIALTWNIASIWTVFAAILLGLICTLSIHIAYEWEKVVVMRFGRFNRVVGPGIYVTIPIVESISAKIDQRIRTASFDAEETLSSDLVPVNVDTVLFWVVWDVERACKQVHNYETAISLAAQTAMRDVIGQICLSEIAMRRTYLDEELKRVISERVDEWGITVVAVEIRDIVIPKELQAAMSRSAQAERERDARLTLAEVERDISDIYLDAATTYGKPEKALQLRTMNLVYDSVRETGGTVVIPSAYSEGFSDAATDVVKDILDQS